MVRHNSPQEFNRERRFVKTQSPKTQNLKPNDKKLKFLNFAYNNFYDIYNEYFDNTKLTPKEKYQLIVRALSIYSECLKYEPISYYLKYLSVTRPAGDIASLRFFEIIRHILVHFPFFTEWNEVSFNRDLILWNNKHSKIDEFLLEVEGREGFKWRIWDNKKKKMRYGFEIKFPSKYKNNNLIYLKDLIDEKRGIEICFIMIKKVLGSQVEDVI